MRIEHARRVDSKNRDACPGAPGIDAQRILVAGLRQIREGRDRSAAVPPADPDAGCALHVRTATTTASRGDTD